MKIVYISNGTVREEIPPYALPVSKWYGVKFEACCVEAPDEVQQGWTYDKSAGRFSPPSPITPVPTTEDDLMTMSIDHEYRLTLLELGVI